MLFVLIPVSEAFLTLLSDTLLLVREVVLFLTVVLRAAEFTVALVLEAAALLLRGAAS